MEQDPKSLEKEAYEFLAQEKYKAAFDLFKKAGEIHRLNKNHKAAALCLASAASCWDLKSGEKAFSNSAQSYKDAARQAEKAGDLAYASLLYRHAAISFERDMDFVDFSEHFYRSKECYRKFLTLRIFFPGRVHNIAAGKKEKRGFGGAITRIFLWLSLSFSALIWGHGERPARTFYSAIFIVFLAAIFYSFGRITDGLIVFRPKLVDAFYFSMMTFTTVGYGDLVPLGLSKVVAMIEAFCGIFMMPLFVIGLSRKYLRI